LMSKKQMKFSKSKGQSNKQQRYLNDKITTVPRTVLRDLSRFTLTTLNTGTIYTGLTVYLGRYIVLHPAQGLSGGTNTGNKGLVSYISNGVVSTGLYVTFLPIKAKIELTITNYDSALVTFNLMEIPFSNASTFNSNNVAGDFTSQACKTLLLSPVGTTGSTKKLSYVMDFGLCNGLSRSQYQGDSNWTQTRGSVGGKFNSFYFNAFRADLIAWVTGLQYQYKIDFECVPISVNKGMVS
jgi:hypothetical protein